MCTVIPWFTCFPGSGVLLYLQGFVVRLSDKG